jgi:hypothetical protein
MVGNTDGVARIDAGGTASAAPAAVSVGAAMPREWDRFAGWPKTPAHNVLFALFLMMLLAAIVPIKAGNSIVSTQSFTENLTSPNETDRPRDDDLALYDRAIERIQAGENYYDFIVEEQRRSDYPVTPGLAVRLPTLAYIDAALGVVGQSAAAILLMFAVLVAWWRRLGEEPCPSQRRPLILAFLFLGASLGVNRYYFTLHELWAGMLLALSFGLHRPGKWGASLAVAALALFIRELALPFVALMGAMALWRRDWKEFAAWSVLGLAFIAVLAIHLSIIADQVLPSDQQSPSWLAMRGLGGWLSNIVLSSNLRFLPHWLAGPAVILAMLGWIGWRSDAGLFEPFLYAGYGLSFTIAGRGDNFYWGAMIAPAMFIGFAFVPMALRSLIAAATAK